MPNEFHGLWKDEAMPVRPARIEDAPQIARVHVDSWRSTYTGIIPEDFLRAMSYEDYEARWCRLLGSEFRIPVIFYVAEMPTGIVGFASGGPRQANSYPEYEGELYALYLLQQHQRQGLGRRLLGAVGEGLLANGKRSMLAWVLADNPSRSFYEVVGGTLLDSQEIEIGGVAREAVAYGWDDVRSIATVNHWQ